MVSEWLWCGTFGPKIEPERRTLPRRSSRRACPGSRADFYCLLWRGTKKCCGSYLRHLITRKGWYRSRDSGHPVWSRPCLKKMGEIAPMAEPESFLHRRNVEHQANAWNTLDERMQTYRFLLEEGHDTRHHWLLRLNIVIYPSDFVAWRPATPFAPSESVRMSRVLPSGFCALPHLASLSNVVGETLIANFSVISSTYNNAILSLFSQQSVSPISIHECQGLLRLTSFYVRLTWNIKTLRR